MMHHLLCCIRTGDLPNRDFTPPTGLKLGTLASSPGSVNQPELDPKTLQPIIHRTPEKLRKSPPKNQSPMKNKVVKTPRPVKRHLFHGIHKSRSRSRVLPPEVEALYREGVEMFRKEQEQNGVLDGSDGNKKKIFKRHSQMFSISSSFTLAKPRKAATASRSSLLFGNSYDKDASTVQLPGVSTKSKLSSDWASAMNLGLPKEPESQRTPSSEFEAEIVIPIRRSSRGFSPGGSSTPFVTPKSTTTPHNKTPVISMPKSLSPQIRPEHESPLAHKRKSSQGTELALDLAPEALMSQLCLDFLDNDALINNPPGKPILRPYAMPSITSSFTSDLNTPLRKVSSTLSTRIQSRAASSDYGRSDPGVVHALRHCRSDNMRPASWGRPPIPVPTSKKNLFRSHRDNGLVSPSAHADGTPAFLVSAAKELANLKDLSPIKEVSSPQRTPALDQVNKTLSAWKVGLDEMKPATPATPKSIMLRSIEPQTTQEQTVGSPIELVDGSSSRYPSKPPSRHESCFQELISTPSEETPPLPKLDDRVTNQNGSNEPSTPVEKSSRPRSFSIGGASTKSTSSVRDSIVRRSLSKIKRGFATPKANAPETVIPMTIPMFPEIAPLRPAASMSTLGSRRGQNLKTNSTTTGIMDNYRTASGALRRVNSVGTIASVMSSESLSPDNNNVRRSYTTRYDRRSRDTRSMSMFSDDSYYSPSQSPCPRDTGESWTGMYDDCVSNPFASYISVNRRTIDFQNMNMAVNDIRSSTVSPIDSNMNGLTADSGGIQANSRNIKVQSVGSTDIGNAQ